MGAAIITVPPRAPPSINDIIAEVIFGEDILGKCGRLDSKMGISEVDEKSNLTRTLLGSKLIRCYRDTGDTQSLDLDKLRPFGFATVPASDASIVWSTTDEATKLFLIGPGGVIKQIASIEPIPIIAAAVTSIGRNIVLLAAARNEQEYFDEIIKVVNIDSGNTILNFEGRKGPVEHDFLLIDRDNSIHLGQKRYVGRHLILKVPLDARASIAMGRRMMLANCQDIMGTNVNPNFLSCFQKEVQ